MEKKNWEKKEQNYLKKKNWLVVRPSWNLTVASVITASRRMNPQYTYKNLRREPRKSYWKFNPLRVNRLWKKRFTRGSNATTTPLPLHVNPTSNLFLLDQAREKPFDINSISSPKKCLQRRPNENLVTKSFSLGSLLSSWNTVLQITIDLTARIR